MEEGERERGGVEGGGMTESGGWEGKRFVNALKILQQPFRCSAIALYWTGEVTTFPITSCLSIPINAHLMPVITTVKIKHSALNFIIIIRHYIIYNTSHQLYFQHNVCEMCNNGSRRSINVSYQDLR